MVRISVDNVFVELSRRGMDQTTWARRAGVSPSTVSRMVKTGQVRTDAFRKLIAALVELPVLEGADSVLDGRQSEASGGAEASRFSQGG